MQPLGVANMRCGINITITAFLTLLIIGSVAFAQAPSQDEQYKTLAEYWSPVICQDVDSTNYLEDYILKFDYDGDYNAWNNKEHIKLQSQYDSTIYYWVAETETHYFIGYGIFYPFDWKGISSYNICAHENDFEGVVMCIKKNGLYGEFVSMTAEAHCKFNSYWDEDRPHSNEMLDEGLYDVDFVRDEQDAEIVGMHPIIYAEARGHGVYANFPMPFNEFEFPTGDTLEDRYITGVLEAPKFVPIEEGLYKCELEYEGDKPSLRFNSDHLIVRSQLNDGRGLVYYIESSNPVPNDGNSLESWPIVGYDLVPINDLWDLRYCSDTNEGPYLEYGVFGGDDEPADLDDLSLYDLLNALGISLNLIDDLAREFPTILGITMDDLSCCLEQANNNSANPPWGWCKSEDSDIFMDPAHCFATEFSPNSGDMSQRYIRKSYGTIYETHHPHERHNTEFSWIVPGSRNLDLNFGRVDLGDEESLYIDGRILSEVTNHDGNTTIRVDGDEFSLISLCSQYSEDQSLNWGFVLDSVNSVPYITRPEGIEVDEGVTLVLNEHLSSEDPDGPSEITYKFRWNDGTEWDYEAEHTFEDDENYSSSILVQLFDGLSESEEYRVPLVVRNVPPSPEINLSELSNSTEDGNTTLQFTIYAGDPAGEYDQPYIYNMTIVRYGNESLAGGNGSSNESIITKDEVYLIEEKQVNDTKFSLTRSFTEGNYTAFVTVTDDGGASGRNETSFWIDQSLNPGKKDCG